MTVKPNGEYVLKLRDLIKEKFELHDVSDINLDLICNNLIMEMQAANPDKDAAEVLVKNFNEDLISNFINAHVNKVLKVSPTVQVNMQPVREQESEDSGEGLMFEVVPEDYSAEDTETDEVSKSKSTLNIEDLHNRALKDGYPEALISESLNNLDDSVYDYASFERFMEKRIDSIHEQEEAEKAKRARIKKAVKFELESVKRIEAPANHLNTLILQTYNTSAVRALTLVKYAEKSGNLDLEVYEKPVYQLILQIGQQWVSDLVYEILATYESNPDVKKYIESYLEAIGVSPENYAKEKASLISFLPEHLQNENSPDAYKQMKAIILIKETQDVKSGENDYEEAILKHTESLINYSAAYENYIEEGVPEEVAEAFATSDAIDDMDDDVKSNIFKGTGSLIGKVVHLRYKVASDFDNAFREGLGEFADDYYANRERVKERKAEMKAKRQEMFSNVADKVEDWADDRAVEKRERQLQREAERRQDYYDSHNYNRSRRESYRDPRYRNYNNSYRNNFSPQIPAWLMATGINVIIGLLVWLIFGQTSAIFTAVGLVISTVGFLKQKHNEPNAGVTIVIGYGLAVACFLLSIM